MTKSTSAAPYARGTGSSFWASLTKALPGEAEPPGCLAAGNHDESGPKTLHLVDALLVNRRTVKSRRKAWDVDNFVVSAALLRSWQLFAENVPRPASARKTPARTINRPIKTRRLKKADCEADFFFMNWLLMWMEFKCEAQL